MDNSEIIDRITRRQKVLVPCHFLSHIEIVDEMRYLASGFDRNAVDEMRLMVHHSSGGFAHFAPNDGAVFGHEYHAMSGVGTQAMKSRVRLEVSDGA